MLLYWRRWIECKKNNKTEKYNSQPSGWIESGWGKYHKLIYPGIHGYNSEPEDGRSKKLKLTSLSNFMVTRNSHS